MAQCQTLVDKWLALNVLHPNTNSKSAVGEALGAAPAADAAPQMRTRDTTTDGNNGVAAFQSMDAQLEVSTAAMSALHITNRPQPHPSASAAPLGAFASALLST